MSNSFGKSILQTKVYFSN